MTDNFATFVCGVDEAGRGPLVGSVVAAAVILDPAKPIEGLKDSKKLSSKKREMLSALIKEKALAWAIGEASAREIDEINILNATMLAMQRAVLALSHHPYRVLVDGNRCPQLPYECEAIVKGDQKVKEISAASILAKVARDDQMARLDGLFPQFGFAKHKGYPTAEHLAALREYGPLSEHRRSFSPVTKLIQK